MLLQYIGKMVHSHLQIQPNDSDHFAQVSVFWPIDLLFYIINIKAIWNEKALLIILTLKSAKENLKLMTF